MFWHFPGNPGTSEEAVHPDDHVSETHLVVPWLSLFLLLSLGLLQQSDLAAVLGQLCSLREEAQTVSSEHPRIDTCLPSVTSIIRTRCLFFFMNGWTVIHHLFSNSLNVAWINTCSTFNFTAFAWMFLSLLQIQLVKCQDVNYKNPFLPQQNHQYFKVWKGLGRSSQATR